MPTYLDTSRWSFKHRFVLKYMFVVTNTRYVIKYLPQLPEYSILFSKTNLYNLQIDMFDYVKHCYNGRYAVGSVLRSWVPELACIIEYHQSKVNTPVLSIIPKYHNSSISYPLLQHIARELLNLSRSDKFSSSIQCFNFYSRVIIDSKV